MSLIHNIVPIRGLRRKSSPIPALRFAPYGVRDNLDASRLIRSYIFYNTF
ncbi:MAG: hypothetical protein K2K84_00340 [Muribaculaceae bacterium]|nr:hypothetical protein [Muribaculaceae bacterium]